MTEGLFTSELGIRGGEADRRLQATRTISLTDFQRRDIYGQYQHIPRAILPRGNAGIYLAARAPDATVTANVVEINLNDGTSTSKITEVPAATSDTVVSVSDVGSVTLPGGTASGSVIDSSTTDPSQETITTPPATLSTSDGIISTTGLSSTTSLLSGAQNGTTALFDPSTSQQRTVTVTATSTFEVSYLNGTVIAAGATSSVSSIQTSTVPISGSASSSDSATFTFGDPVTTSSVFSQSSGTTGDGLGGSSSASVTGAAGSEATGASATTSSGSAATSESSSGSGSGSGGGSAGLTPTQQQVVGGVVGGVAGMAVILIILLVVLRWYRRRLQARGQLPEQRGAREISGGPGNSYPMSQRSSIVPLAAAVTHGFKRLRPHSHQTFATTATGATDPGVRDSERGFQRIAGRKIAPVLSSGGDPYGGNYGAFEKDASAGPSDPLQNSDRGLSGASFYRDSDGFYGGKGSHSPTFPPSPTTAATGSATRDAGAYSDMGHGARDFGHVPDMSVQNASQISLTNPSRPEGFAVMRPSPARTPVTLSPAASFIRLPIQQPPTMAEDAPPMPSAGLMPGSMQRDGLGRSLASQDGSRVSRSSGRSGGRFTENM